MRQPDEVISSLEAQIDSIQLQHSLGHKFAYDPWGGMLIKTDLNTALETVCAVMNEEIGRAFSATWKDDTENWTELDLFPACRAIVGRATLRFTLGDSPVGQKLGKCCTHLAYFTRSDTNFQSCRRQFRSKLLWRSGWHA